MIVRVIGQGQLELPTGHLDELNELDAALTESVTARDEHRFGQDLTRLLDRVQALGTPVPDYELRASDFVLPGPGSSLAEVLALLGAEGLIPG